MGRGESHTRTYETAAASVIEGEWTMDGAGRRRDYGVWEKRRPQGVPTMWKAIGRRVEGRRGVRGWFFFF